MDESKGAFKAPIIINTDALEWLPMASRRLSCKLLKGNPETGPHTMLLRSKQRLAELGPAQYHDADEEFVCLSGSVTFDSETWFEPLSYGRFPAHVVHGADVIVPDHYVLLVHLGGPGRAHWVEAPASKAPYPRSGGDREDVIAIHDLIGKLGKPKSAKSINLMTSNKSGRSTDLCFLPVGTWPLECLPRYRGFEIFVISGEIVIDGAGKLPKNFYGYFEHGIDNNAIAAESESVIVVMVN